MKEAQIFSLFDYVNHLIVRSTKKPSWGLSEKEKRADRYASAYHRNEKLITMINSQRG